VRKRTKADLEAEIAELKERVKLQDAVIYRLTFGPPTQLVPMPYPVPSYPPSPFWWQGTTTIGAELIGVTS